MHQTTRALLVALALVAPPPAWGATLLRLSASASVAVTADRLSATLRAEARGAAAAAAQATVNGLIHAAIVQAAAVSGLRVVTGGYNVWHLAPPDGRWEASQSLTISGGDAPALLALVGRLQGQGLVVGGLDWGLSRHVAAAAQEKAQALAITRLRADAKRAARLLGLRFDHFREVTLGEAGPPPPRPMMMMAARGAVPPSALAGPQRVRASVSALAVLGED